MEILTDGFTLAGMAMDTVTVFLPTSVLPFFVTSVKVTLTLVPDVFCAARDSGGVKEQVCELPFPVMLPRPDVWSVRLPHAYVSVWVKLVLALAMVRD